MLSYRLFQLRLLLHLITLSFSNSLLPIKKRASFAAAEILTALILGLLLTQLFSSNNPTIISEPVYADLPVYHHRSFDQELLTREEISSRIAQYSNLLDKQPTHFDLILNLSLLEQARGNNEKAAEYWEMAREIHPNAEVFQR